MHNCTFSVKPLKDCTQATDYGATILQLIIMGENPYDYKGSNYVEALANDQTHTYANDIFRLLAYTAAGYNYDEELVDTVKAKAKSKSFDLDMRGWSLIAISSLLDKEETLGIAEAFKEKAETEGLDTGMFVGDYGANAFTQGCVISGLVSAGVDIGSDDWHFNDIDPLAVIENYYVSEEGKIYQVNPKNKPFYWGTVACDYNKDMIIALGDIVQGSSVWQRQALTRQKFDSLVEKATALSKGNKGTEAQKANVKAKLQAAQAAANGVGATEIKGLGSSYYALYEAMSKIDASMKLTDPNAKKVKTGLRQLIKKLAEASAIRSSQADSVAVAIANSKYPTIITCGDFNDASISYTHRILTQQLDDAFTQSGRGLGISYNLNKFYFRIDNILISPNQKAYNCTVDRSIKDSDHYPIWCYIGKQ